MILRTISFTLAILAATPTFADVKPVPGQAEWVDARQSLTTPDGLEMTYVAMGGSEGTPLIMVHGYTDNSRGWSELAPHLGDRPMIALDLRGHGGTQAPQCCYSPDDFAHDIVGAMDTLGIERADIIGHSLGAITAANLAGIYPDRVEKLVLIGVGTSVPAGTLDWLWENIPALPDVIDPESQFMLDWYSDPNPVNEDFKSRERAESAATERHVWMAVLEALSSHDWSYLARRIKAETVIFWGDQDKLFPLESQNQLRAVLPEAKLVVIEGAGHNPNWEDPEGFAQLLNQFLSD